MKKFLSVIPVILVLILALSGVKVWKGYRDTLMKNQEDQLLTLTKILRDNIAVAMEEYQNDLDFLCDVKDTEQDDCYKKYLEEQKNFICNLYRETSDGKRSYIAGEIAFQDLALLASYPDDRSIWLMSDMEKKYLVLKEKMSSGDWLCMVVDAGKYYQRLISDIHVGTNGYIIVKNKEGTVIMHPDKEQWGLNIISGRKKRFPDLDYSSLENMLKEQRDGKEGIFRYYSYWWTKPDVKKVEKISAYCSTEIGDDAWIISAVIDYDDFYRPIVEGFLKLTMVFVSALLLAGILVLVYGRLLIRVRKSAKEIEDLKELNSLLESVQKSENAIAHQERLQIMGTMTGGIAHEFNNFLTPIMGHAELLMMELPEGSEEQDSAKEILEASEKAMDVVKQISSLSRKNVETVYKSIPVKKMMQRVVKMISSVCPPQITLESDILIQDECILGNTTQLNQVILNICVNAVHAIGKKAGNINIRCGNITSRTMKEILKKEIPDTWKNYIFISIRDDGCGMDKDVLRQIFDPFFTTKKGGEGTGLGLALAEQIITSHKGYIFAESQPEKGSTFYIGIPVLDAGQSEMAVTVSEKREIQMLIADDNAKVLKLLRDSLEKIGIGVTTCVNLEEVSEKFTEQEVDVLIVEEKIEGKSGVDYCMSIAGKYPDMIRLISIDSISKEILEAKNKEIIHGYVEKPMSDRNILEAVRECRKQAGS